MKWHDVATMQQLNVNAEAVDTRDAGSKLVDAGLKRKDKGSEAVIGNVLKVGSRSHHQVDRWDLVK